MVGKSCGQERLEAAVVGIIGSERYFKTKKVISESATMCRGG